VGAGMRSRKAPRIRLDSAKAVPQVLFQAFLAAFILYAFAVSTNIVESSIQGHSIGHQMEVSHLCAFSIILQVTRVDCGTYEIYALFVF
jgi:hypothetical protein